MGLARTLASAPLEPDVVALMPGMVCLGEDGWSRPTPSLTTIEEVLRVTP
ncbi:hypothetical protein [Microbacterium immunditiarum]|uniref:Uncharacterized protein n=1 Tax=Microbacterium immunditiarum TaxID=337480 RepID=A0A7Y9KKC4_9MICO|nr:hypothetical protein [Microbacterium immunditiarum]NYE20680.1 hypothetical protein [Microbacterium immunditiarum]